MPRRSEARAGTACLFLALLLGLSAVSLWRLLAGDSMVAALTLKLAERASLEEMLRWGVAAGTAATLRHGTQLCDPQATARLAAEVHIGR